MGCNVLSGVWAGSRSWTDELTIKEEDLYVCQQCGVKHLESSIQGKFSLLPCPNCGGFLVRYKDRPTYSNS
jgi:hypothetical protein